MWPVDGNRKTVSWSAKPYSGTQRITLPLTHKSRPDKPGRNHKGTMMKLKIDIATNN
ncbi:glycosyl transferase family 1, partial [Neisseria meningitidis]